MLNLEALGEKIRARLAKKDAQREKALALSREVIRLSSVAIRSVHRGEHSQGEAILVKVASLLADLETSLSGYRDLAQGYVDDARKEYAEASLFLAIVQERPLPRPEELGVGDAPYLNGLGEAAGELRRYLLDSLRRGEVERGEELLSAMDEIYSLLISMDFPEAITGGLRRTTDMVRGVVERSRGDLTTAVQQQRLLRRLDRRKGQRRTQGPQGGDSR